MGFDSYLIKLENGITTINDLFLIKSIEEVNSEYIIVATSTYGFKLRISDLKIVDTIWKGRCTKVFYGDGKYYIGTLYGIYEINSSKEINYLGNKSAQLT